MCVHAHCKQLLCQKHAPFFIFFREQTERCAKKNTHGEPHQNAAQRTFSRYPGICTEDHVGVNAPGRLIRITCSEVKRMEQGGGTDS